MAAGIELGYFGFMAWFAFGGGGAPQDVSVFVFFCTGIAFIHFVAVPAGDASKGHGAVPILVDDAGSVAFMAGDTFIPAVR